MRLPTMLSPANVIPKLELTVLTERMLSRLMSLEVVFVPLIDPAERAPPMVARLCSMSSERVRGIEISFAVLAVTGMSLRRSEMSEQGVFVNERAVAVVAPPAHCRSWTRGDERERTEGGCESRAEWAIEQRTKGRKTESSREQVEEV